MGAVGRNVIQTGKQNGISPNAGKNHLLSHNPEGSLLHTRMALRQVYLAKKKIHVMLYLNKAGQSVAVAKMAGGNALRLSSVLPAEMSRVLLTCIRLSLGPIKNAVFRIHSHSYKTMDSVQQMCNDKQQV